MRMIPTTPEEKTAALKSLRKEAYRLGKTEGKAEGRRQALLAVVAISAPDILERLERIDDVAVLEREVAELIRGRRS